jgi:hypothetical protein
MLTVVLFVGGMLFGQVAPGGNAIVTPPAPAPTTSNVTVNITPPPPDPAATRAMYGYVIATTEFDHASAPVDWASGLLKGANIWTRTPAEHFDIDIVKGMRNAARNAALGLFLLGVVWTGLQLAAGSGLGTTSYQQLLPLVIAGFLVAWYAESIGHRAIDLCNWLNERLGNPSLADFSSGPLTMPEQPDSQLPGIVQIPASFFSGVLGSFVFAVVLIVLELKMIFREAILFVTDVVMPISGVLWAFGITRGWGVQLYRLFFGSLYGQPLVVVCLALAGSLLTALNLTDGASQFLVKLAVLFLAIKMVSFLSGAGLGAGGMFGMAGLLFLLRRAQGLTRRGAASSGGNGQPATPPANTAAVQSGRSSGTGSGDAASGRPWRPAMGTA